VKSVGVCNDVFFLWLCVFVVCVECFVMYSVYFLMFVCIWMGMSLFVCVCILDLFFCLFFRE